VVNRHQFVLKIRPHVTFLLRLSQAHRTPLSDESSETRSIHRSAGHFWISLSQHQESRQSGNLDELGSADLHRLVMDGIHRLEFLRYRRIQHRLDLLVQPTGYLSLQFVAGRYSRVSLCLKASTSSQVPIYM